MAPFAPPLCPPLLSRCWTIFTNCIIIFSESSGKKRKNMNPFKKMKRFFSSRMKKGKEMEGERAVPVGYKAKSASDVLGAHRGEITEDR